MALSVRPIHPADESAAELVVSWRSDPASSRMFYRANFTREDFARTYFEPDAPRPVFILDDGEKPIAVLRFRSYAQFRPPLPAELAGGKVFDIGVLVSPAERGKGYGSRAISLATEYALRAGAERLVAEIKPENVPSIRAFERAGYRHLDRVEKRIPEVPDPFEVLRLIYP